MSNEMPPQDNDPGQTEFAPAERALFAEVRSWITDQGKSASAQAHHRMLLGAASELIDAAADLAATHRPGVRVVELGLLAERVAQLAFGENEENGV